MATLKYLQEKVEKASNNGKVAMRLWDSGFIDVMILSNDPEGRFVYNVTLHNGSPSTINFSKTDRVFERNIASQLEVMTPSQSQKMRKFLEGVFWPEF